MSLAAIIAIVGLATLTTGATLTLSLLLNAAHKQSRAASDTASEWRRKHDETASELRLAYQTIKAKEAEVQVYKDRLVAAEQQRNEAMEEARDHFVQRLAKAGIADAAKFGADLLALDLRTRRLQPENQRLSDHPIDGLIDPSKP